MITINSLEEMEKYYNKRINTYEFVKDDKRLDVKFTFDLNINASICAKNLNAKRLIVINIDAWRINLRELKANNINAHDIKVDTINAHDMDARNVDVWSINANNIDVDNIDANNIKVNNIKAWDIKAHSINANNINYHACCFAYESFKCKSIKGRRKNSRHFCLDNEIEYIKTRKIKIDDKEIEISNESYNKLKESLLN